MRPGPFLVMVLMVMSASTHAFLEEDALNAGISADAYHSARAWCSNLLFKPLTPFERRNELMIICIKGFLGVPQSKNEPRLTPKDKATSQLAEAFRLELNKEFESLRKIHNSDQKQKAIKAVLDKINADSPPDTQMAEIPAKTST